MSITKSNIKSRKTGQLITSIILGILLLITGTFAWNSGTQRAFNPRWELEGAHGGRIHDRFIMTEYIDGSGTQNLNIFAENFGETDIFVRIRLREFLAFDREAVGIGGATRDNPDSWPIYQSSDTYVGQRRLGTPSLEIGQTGISWTMGQTDPFVFMPTFNRATRQATDISPSMAIPELYEHLDAYRMTEATGDAVDWYSHEAGGAIRDVPEQGNITHIPDFEIYGTQTGPGLDPANHRTLDNGLIDNWNIGDTLTSDYLYTYIVDPTDATSPVELRLGDAPRTHTAQNNLMPSISGTDVPTNVPTNFPGVITMTEWNQWGQPEGNFWIHDTTNDQGWFYWNGFLLAGAEDVSTATSLLLEAIHIPTNWQHEWEYVVMADGEFFIPRAIEGMGISTAALDIFERAEEDVFLGGTVTITPDGVVSSTIEGMSYVPGPNGTYVVTLPAGTNRHLINVEITGAWTHTIVEEADTSITITFSPPAPTYSIAWNNTHTIDMLQGWTESLGYVTVTRTLANGTTQNVPVTFDNANVHFEILGQAGNVTFNNNNVIAGPNATVGGRNIVAVFTDANGVQVRTPQRQIMIHPAVNIPTVAHQTFTDPETGTVWRVLLPDDGTGRALIITEYVHLVGTTRFHSDLGFTLFQAAEIQTTVRNWWNNPGIAGGAMRTIALDYEFQDNTGEVAIARTSTATGAGIEVDREAGSENATGINVPIDTNELRGRTRPLTVGAGSGEPFILSTSEANHYFTGATGATGRQTQNVLNTTVNSQWWLRSPANSTTATSDARQSNVNANGNVGGHLATGVSASRGVRPALWVRR